MLFSRETGRVTPPAWATGYRVIPDVHGQRDALSAALDAAREVRQLAILLGDLGDRGPDSAGCYVLAVEAVEQNRAVLLDSNHDNKVVRALRGGNVQMNDELAETLRGIEGLPDAAAFKERLLRVHAGTPHWLRVGNTFFAHAACMPNMVEAGPFLPKSMASLAIVGQTDKLNPRGPDGKPNRIYRWLDFVPAGQTVVIGHDIIARDRIVERVGAQGGRLVHLDLGCGYTDNLAALELDLDGRITARHVPASPVGQKAQPARQAAPQAPRVAKPSIPVPIAHVLFTPPVRQICDILEAAGAEGRIVGGAVRNLLVNRPAADIDLCANRPAEELAEIFQAAGLSVIPTGLQHGTVTVLVPDGGEHREPFEITSLRRDLASVDRRHAEVEWISCFVEDAERRDFTMNAMSIDTRLRLHDQFNGVEDLKANIVRFVGDAEARIQEDVLRILRLHRFSAEYTRDSNPVEIRNCQIIRNLLYQGVMDGLSGERIQKEMLRLVKGPFAPRQIGLMRENGVLQAIGVDPAWLDGPARHRFVTAWRGSASPIGHVAALLPDEAACTAVDERWKLSRRDGQRLRCHLMLRRELGPDAPISAFIEMGVMRGVPQEDMSDFLRAQDRETAALAILEALPVFPLRGGQLVRQLGLTPGPVVGETLETLREMWRQSGFKATGDELLADWRASLGSEASGEDEDLENAGPA